MTTVSSTPPGGPAENQEFSQLETSLQRLKEKKEGQTESDAEKFKRERLSLVRKLGLSTLIEEVESHRTDVRERYKAYLKLLKVLELAAKPLLELFKIYTIELSDHLRNHFIFFLLVEADTPAKDLENIQHILLEAEQGEGRLGQQTTISYRTLGITAILSNLSKDGFREELRRIWEAFTVVKAAKPKPVTRELTRRIADFRGQDVLAALQAAPKKLPAAAPSIDSSRRTVSNPDEDKNILAALQEGPLTDRKLYEVLDRRVPTEEKKTHGIVESLQDGKKRVTWNFSAVPSDFAEFFDQPRGIVVNPDGTLIPLDSFDSKRLQDERLKGIEARQTAIRNLSRTDEAVPLVLSELPLGIRFTQESPDNKVRFSIVNSALFAEARVLFFSRMVKDQWTDFYGTIVWFYNAEIDDWDVIGKGEKEVYDVPLQNLWEGRVQKHVYEAIEKELRRDLRASCFQAVTVRLPSGNYLLIYQEKEGLAQALPELREVHIWSLTEEKLYHRTVDNGGLIDPILHRLIALRRQAQGKKRTEIDEYAEDTALDLGDIENSTKRLPVSPDEIERGVKEAGIMKLCLKDERVFCYDPLTDAWKEEPADSGGAGSASPSDAEPSDASGEDEAEGDEVDDHIAQDWDPFARDGISRAQREGVLTVEVINDLPEELKRRLPSMHHPVIVSDKKGNRYLCFRTSLDKAIHRFDTYHDQIFCLKTDSEGRSIGEAIKDPNSTLDKEVINSILECRQRLRDVRRDYFDRIIDPAKSGELGMWLFEGLGICLPSAIKQAGEGDLQKRPESDDIELVLQGGGTFVYNVMTDNWERPSGF